MYEDSKHSICMNLCYKMAETLYSNHRTMKRIPRLLRGPQGNEIPRLQGCSCPLLTPQDPALALALTCSSLMDPLPKVESITPATPSLHSNPSLSFPTSSRK